MLKTSLELQRTHRFSVFVAPGSSAGGPAIKLAAISQKGASMNNSEPSPAAANDSGSDAKTEPQSTDKALSSATDLSLDKMDADALAAAVTRQGSLVRQLKKDGAAPGEVKAAEGVLQDLRSALAAAEAAAVATDTFDRKALDDVIIRRMFVVPSFEIHGGVKGLYDFGPPGCGLKSNIVDLWKRHFVLMEGMLEMECTNLTPENVLQTSGHVEKFADLMVKDSVTGEPYRADKLLEDLIDDLLEKNPDMPQEEREEHLRVQRQADAYSPEELGDILDKYDAKSPPPACNPLTKPFPFNLMFKTSIGPGGGQVGYFRPETAQGLFVNFRRLLDYNAQKMPFAAAQIEHFVDPQNKRHPKFAAVAGKELVLFGREDQLGTGKTRRMTIGEAVSEGLVNNETLGYFMARTQIFLEVIGMDPRRMRFRQHLTTEMAHYAADCWDMEIKVSYGWTECVGHADRSCYDLDMHSKKTGVSMVASCQLDEPRMVTEYKLKVDRKAIGTKFKADQKKVMAALEALSERECDLLEFEGKLESEGKATLGDERFEIAKGMVSWTKGTKKVTEIKFTPSVIEPSFGIGRILYSLLEHSFYVREGDEGADDAAGMKRGVMSFRPLVAPIKCAILPLSSQAAFMPICAKVMEAMGERHLSARLDASGAALGRRYARMDELGVPFGMTVDFQTIEDSTVTLRERDSMTQIRLPLSDVAPLVEELVKGACSWKDCTTRYPLVGGEEQLASTNGSTAGHAAQAESSGSCFTIEKTSAACFSRPNPPIKVDS